MCVGWACFASPTNHQPAAEVGLVALDEFATDNTFTFPIGGGEAATYSLKFIGRYRQNDAVHTVTLSPAQTLAAKPRRQVSVTVPVTSQPALGALHSGASILVIVDVTGSSEKGTSSATYSLCLVRGSATHDIDSRSTPAQPVSQLFPGHLSGKDPTC